MVNYERSIGSTGTMRITDTGTYVEFWLNSNNSTTFNHALPYGYTVNGVTDHTNTYDYNANSGWELLRRWTVSTAQTVTFQVYDTNTSGFGTGGVLTAAISRTPPTSVPPKPPIWAIEQIRNTSVQGDVDGAGTGGLTLDEFQVRYSLSSSATSPMYQSDDTLDGYFWIYGLTPATTYYFWVRTHNSKGWSPWSSVSSAKTHNVPRAGITLSNEGQTSIDVTLFKVDDGGSTILEYQLLYGRTIINVPEDAEFLLSGTFHSITNLAPGAKYYYRARARNTYGWGPLSFSTTSETAAGAWVDVNGVKTRAVPYVNVGGTWYPTIPHAKIAGLWKATG